MPGFHLRRSLIAARSLATGAALLIAAGAAAATLSPPFELAPGQRAAPFGNAVPRDIVNYGRAAPAVGLSGQPTVAGVEAAKALGFALLVDLRQPDEPGVADEAARAAAIGLDRLSLPMPAEPGPALDAFVERLGAILDEPRNHPLLLSCGSANRAAAAWALYRARRGVPANVAIEEGRALGLTGREALVRQALGLPQLTPR